MEEPKIIKGYPTLTTVLGMDNTKFMIIDEYTKAIYAHDNNYFNKL